MTEEIRFFGFGNNFHNSEIRQKFEEINVNCPAVCTMNSEVIRNSNPNDFPWPIVMDCQDSKPQLIESWGGLQEALDNIRSVNPAVSFRLPTITPELSAKKYAQIFLGKDYICIYNQESDLGVTIDINNDYLYNNSEDQVYKLIFGHFGLTLDETIRTKELVEPITKNRISDLGNAEASFDFGFGYKIGFSSEESCSSLFKRSNYSQESYIGDPKVFGYFIGCMIREFLFVNLNLSLNTYLDKVAVALACSTLSGPIQNKVIDAIKLHNSIIASNLDLDLFVKVINSINNGKLNLVDYINCGGINKHLESIAMDIYSLSKNPGVELHPFTGSLNTSSVKFKFLAEKIQFRILSHDNSSVSIRLQMVKPEVIHDIWCDNESHSIISWKNGSKLETDVSIKLHHITSAISDLDWSSWLSKLGGVVFDQDSTYSGSNNKYCKLIFTSEGLSLEDGTIVIPMIRFVKTLKNTYNINVFGA